MVYNQENISKNKFKRVIKESVESDELIWHMDYSDRKVFVESGNDWLLQMDNELPQVLQEGQTYFIPKMTYHRVIKGSGDLKMVIDESFDKIRVPQVVKNTVRKNLYRLRKEGADMRIPNMLVESQYVTRDVVTTIKSFCDGIKNLNESNNPYNDKDNLTYLSYGGQKGYEWVINSLVG